MNADSFDWASLVAPLLIFLLASLPLLAVLPSAPPLIDDPRKEPRMNLLQKAAANQNLSPFERGLLKFGQTLLWTAGLAVLPALSQALNNPGAIDWRGTLHLMLFSGASALLLGIVKYLKAQGDDPLLDAVEGVLEAGAQRLTAANGLNTPVIEPDPEPPTNAPQSATLAEAA